MADDVTKTTLAVLLVLAIVVSVIGTWTVLELAGDTSLPDKSPKSIDGEVSVQVGPVPEISDDVGGEVSVQIV